jgi:hypothetical protein
LLPRLLAQSLAQVALPTHRGDVRAPR